MPVVLRRVRTLIVKEFLILLRDPRGRAMLVGPPIIQLILFAYSVTLEISNVDVAVLNQDAGVHGLEIASRIEASPYFAAGALRGGFGDIETALDRQEILVAVVIPQDFSAKLARGDSSPFQIVADGRKSNAVQIVIAYINEIVTQYSSELAADASAPAVATAPRHWFNPNLIYVWSIIPSLMAIITLIMTLNLSAMSLAREKELGTFEQLLVTPFTPAEIIVGKLIPAMLIAVFESMLIYGLGRLLYGVPMRGSFPLLMTAIVLFSFSVIGFGLFTSSIVKTQQQAIVGSFIFMVPCVALSGFISPVENMPLWLQKAVVVNPLKPTLVILKGIFLKDMPAGEVWLNAWPLVAIGVVSIAFSGWLFRRNLG